MWSNDSQLNLNGDRLKEYQRQQDRLKAMTTNAEKARSVSTDLMIESLLKDSFKKPSTSVCMEKSDTFFTDLPLWLQCESQSVPTHFKYLWSLVESSFDLADTQKVSKLLLTSGLNVDVLGFIWSLANKSVPGQLTKQEFYIVLALVGLAQTGCTFNNLSVLKLLFTPSIPVLQSDVLKIQLPQTISFGKSDTLNLNSSPKPENAVSQPLLTLNSSKDSGSECSKVLHNTDMSKTTGLSSQSSYIKVTNNSSSEYINNKANILNVKETKSTKFPSIGLSPTAELDDDFSEFQSVPAGNFKASEKSSKSDVVDDFTDFQSANVEQIDPLKAMIISQKKEIPKIPLPKNFPGKFSNFKSSILKISPESERKLKKLSSSETLSSLPESKISTSNKVSTSISMIGSNHEIGSRLANHSLSAKLKHHKHRKIKMASNLSPPLYPEEEIILGVKTSNMEVVIPKCCPKRLNCNSLILKETVIRNENIPQSEDQEKTKVKAYHSGENTRQIEIPTLGTLNETILPSQVKSSSNIDLMSVQEDKYSALREIELDISQKKIDSTLDSAEGSDEFSDFFSANALTPSASVQNLSSQNSESIPVNLLLNSDKKETWGDWNFISKPGSNSTGTMEVLNSKDPFESINSKTEQNNLFESFNLLSLNDEKLDPNISSTSNSLLETELSSTLDLATVIEGDITNKFTEHENKENERGNHLFSCNKSIPLPSEQPHNEFWDFAAFDPKHCSESSLSRHGSLPSLDLKVSINEELDQEVVWRKSLEACLSLLEEAFEIFNNICTKSIMNEVFTSPKTSEYLNGLYIVHQISKRIILNCSEPPSSQKDLEKLWQKLQELCFEYNVKLINDEVNNLKSNETCAICLGYIGNYTVTQGSNNYHTSCANLWINFVDDTLPYST